MTRKTRSRYRARSTSPVYFIAFCLAAAFVCIVLPLIITRGR